MRFITSTSFSCFLLSSLMKTTGKWSLMSVTNIHWMPFVKPSKSLLKNIIYQSSWLFSNSSWPIDQGNKGICIHHICKFSCCSMHIIIHEVDIIVTHNIALFILFLYLYDDSSILLWNLSRLVPGGRYTVPTIIFLSIWNTPLGISIRTDSIHSSK